MIKLEQITKRIGQKTVLEDFSMTLSQGELVAITGKSGSGKTTLLNIIGLIDGDYTGRYTLFDEENIKVNSRQSQKMIRERISYLFQNFALIESETVEYNLLMALHYSGLSKRQKREMIKDILSKVHLEDALKQTVAELSGGEQQRIAVARAILKPSCLVLADEPTGSLDPENRDIILHFLLDMHTSGKTVIIVTHDPYVAEKCSRRIHLGE